jgi:hypothetical protein
LHRMNEPNVGVAGRTIGLLELGTRTVGSINVGESEQAANASRAAAQPVAFIQRFVFMWGPRGSKGRS